MSSENKEKRLRVTVYLDETIVKTIRQMAIDNRRSFSQQTGYLLENAEGFRTALGER